MIKVSATTIELFRQYIKEEKFFGNELMPIEKLIANIKGEKESSPEQSIGVAFHEVLEKPFESYDRYARNCGGEEGFMALNGNCFEYDIIVPAYTIIDYNFPFEVKSDKIYYKEGECIKVVAKADQLEGRWVNEHKTCFGSIYLTREGELTTGESYDFERYYKSYQWRLYLDIFKADRVQYKIFELANDKTNNHRLKLLDIHTPSFFPYPEMSSDIHDLLSEFLSFINNQNLREYFKDKI